MCIHICISAQQKRWSQIDTMLSIWDIPLKNLPCPLVDQDNYGKSPFSMDKSTKMAAFRSYVNLYQRVHTYPIFVLNPNSTKQLLWELLSALLLQDAAHRSFGDVLHLEPWKPARSAALCHQKLVSTGSMLGFFSTWLSSYNQCSMIWDFFSGDWINKIRSHVYQTKMPMYLRNITDAEWTCVCPRFSADLNWQ